MENRRELATRKIKFFQTFAKVLIRIGFTPNQISVLSMVFAGFGGYGFYLISKDYFSIGWILAFSGIQLRLLCNMVDGLMAIEGLKKSSVGEIYNDLPDRISDVILFLAASLVIKNTWAANLGWLVSMLAVMTAYVRVLGSSMGQKADFCGPMAKQHRMALLNITLITALVAHLSGFFVNISFIFYISLMLIAAGSFWTFWRRLYRLNKNLKKKEISSYLVNS